MNNHDLEIYEYRKSKEILYHNYIIGEKMRTDYEKVSVRTETAGYIDAYVYRPEGCEGKEKLPVVFDFHGGGMVLGNWQLDCEYCRNIANKTKSAVVVMDYCLAPEFKFPKPIYAAYEAVKGILDMSETLCFDRENVFFIGHSAGGYLSTAICLIGQDELKVKGLIQDYAIYRWIATPELRKVKDATKSIATSRMLDYFLWYFEKVEDCNHPLAMLPDNSLSKMPETLTIAAEYDSLANEAEEYVKKALKDGCKAKLIVFEKCRHGFTHECFSEYDEEKAEQAWDMIIRFIKEIINR